MAYRLNDLKMERDNSRIRGSYQLDDRNLLGDRTFWGCDSYCSTHSSGRHNCCGTNPTCSDHCPCESEG